MIRVVEGWTSLEEVLLISQKPSSNVWRVICRQDSAEQKRLVAEAPGRCGNRPSGKRLDIVALGPAAWREMLRNVPVENRQEKEEGVIVAVTVKMMADTGPILVLFSLKYPGNIGTIIRSAVQSNQFQAIYLVDPIDKQKIAKLKDISYYSMGNMSLIEFKRFPSVSAFMHQMDRNRAMIALDLHEKSINMYDLEARSVFRECFPSMYLLIGAEDVGVPEKLFPKCRAIMEIPNMSSSINVGCAFMAMLSTMNIALLHR